MGRRMLSSGVLLAAALFLAPRAGAQSFGCEEQVHLDETLMACYRYGPEQPPPPPPAPAPEPKADPFQLRALKYAALAIKHKLQGLASYYSTSLDGTQTATGEIFRNRKFTAAHLTLPLGSWVEITSRATGRKIRCLVNDRGPYAKKFTIDLSQAAARALGVDVASDRYVDIRIVALPGEQPLPDDWQLKTIQGGAAAAVAVVTPEE